MKVTDASFQGEKKVGGGVCSNTVEGTTAAATSVCTPPAGCAHVPGPLQLLIHKPERRWGALSHHGVGEGWGGGFVTSHMIGWWLAVTHISCRGRLISTLSLFTAGSADPRDASASLPRSLIWSVKDTSGGRKRRAGVLVIILGLHDCWSVTGPSHSSTVVIRLEGPS